MSLLRRLQPHEQLAAVERAWVGKVVICIASGPSLSEEQLERVKRAREADAVRVIVVNDVYLVAPWADVLYFADHRWWQWHKDGVAKSWPWARFTRDEVRKAFAEFKGQKVTIKHQPMATDLEVLALLNDGPEGLSEKPEGIRTGSNSGYQALNIAVLSGGNPIILLGYDMRFQGSRTHSHCGHQVKMHESAYKSYARKFLTIERPLGKLGVKVLNCTPGSALESFTKADLDACLELHSFGALVQTASV